MKRTLISFVSIFSLSALTLTGCSQGQSVSPAGDTPTVSKNQSASVEPSNDPQYMKLQGGALVAIQHLGGKTFFQAEATFSDVAFSKISAYASGLPSSQREAAIDAEVSRVMNELHAKAGALELSRRSPYGFLKFMLPFEGNDLLSAVKGVVLSHEMLINPVVSDKETLKEIKKMSKDMNKSLRGASTPPDSNTDSYSGLVRIHAPEFVRMAEKAIGGGVKINGDSVKIGATDTGITYNHPTFLSGDHKSVRIAYMKDFSREGRVYFAKDAKMKAVSKNDGSMDVEAEVIVTPRLPALPAGDLLRTIKVNLVVPNDLATIISAANSPARLGILDENNFKGDVDQVDLNQNGKLDEKWPVIFVPGDAALKTEDRIYVDFTGKGDFTNSKPLRNWNTSHDMTQIQAEKLGFDIRSDDKLPNQDGSALVIVSSASIVGFDPGNHGSHVSGIAAGNKTIANDQAMTLARGVAPEATLMMNRVCSNTAGCNATEAMIDMASAGAQVINMSLGGLNPFNDGFGVEETIVNRVSSLANTLYVISAGNSGPARQTIGSPSTARLSLSVGASASVGMIQRQYQWPASGAPVDLEHDRDLMLFFSSRGPTANGGFKPNISAPGTELSSVQINASPGSNAGLDIYWGTSMAAPTATGAYALFLDAIQKHNAKDPAHALASDSLTLRRVLIESARPFDVESKDLSTGAVSHGQYTWADEGQGNIDLVAAWKKLIALRDAKAPTAVNDGKEAVELDYQVLVPEVAPNGIAYDGSRVDKEAGPEFGAGIHLDAKGKDTFRQVYIARQLPAVKAAANNAADLTRQLKTTADEFVLKTAIYGSDQPWVKAGAMTDPSCPDVPTHNLMLFGPGVEVTTDSTGAGSINTGVLKDSILNVCIDRQAIAHDLAPGDHGALISAYRKANGVVSPVASFTVPVFVTIPHQVLAHATGYEVSGSAKSFDVVRNYVDVPQGTSVVQISVEVPALKLDSSGLRVKGEECSGVEFMAQEGDNTDIIFDSRPHRRVVNCKPDGSPADDAARVIRFSRTNPNAGIWDLHIFGSYQFSHSKYKLRVDYVTATSDVTAIQGDLKALNGSLQWNVKDESAPVKLDAALSSYALNGLKLKSQQSIDPNGHNYVKDSKGAIARTYADDVQKVTLHIDNSPGNDIDLFVFECDPTAKDPNDPSCTLAGKSDGPTDTETVVITPKSGMGYIADVEASTVHQTSTFDFSETRGYAPETGAVTVSGTTAAFKVGYSFNAAASALAKNPLFLTEKYSIEGALTLRAADGSSTGSVMDVIPVEILAKTQ